MSTNIVVAQETGSAPENSLADSPDTGDKTSLLRMLMRANSMLPESKRSKNTELLDVHTAMHSVLLVQAGAIHPDLKDSEEQKATDVLRRHRDLFDMFVSLQQQPQRATYEPGASPVYRLPFELLARIFVLLADQPPHERIPYASPIALTQVCRWWRTVAEQTPQLWSHMPMARGLNWTQRALQYSQNTPLDVMIFAFHVKNPENYKHAVRLTLEELPRIRSLNLTVEQDIQSEVSVLLRSKPASALVKLEYGGRSYGADDSEDLDGELFTGACPEQLRVVDIRDTTILLDCPIFHSQLTTLRLHYCSVWATIDSMMRTLAEIPSLEHFSWTIQEEVMIQIHEDDPIETEPRSVQLPNLKTLELQDEIMIPLDILTRLDIPPSASILIHGNFENISHRPSIDAALVRLDETLGARLTAVMGEENFTKLTLTEFAGDNDSGYSAVFEEPSHPSNPEKFMLGFCYLSDQIEEYDALLARMLCWGPCYRAVRQVAMRHDLEFLHHPGCWSTIVDRLPFLEEIHVRDDAGCALLSALSDKWEILPTLRKVLLRDAHGLADVDVDQIVEALDSRQDSGFPRVSFSFVNCDITEDQVVALEQCTGTDEVFCFPRVSKEMLEMAKRFGFELPPAAMLSAATGGGTIL
ncbi:hypothetical protein PENSPDRAFT_739409 [Peniophora sp. CONT]|nr:hypothetical protein PENSPDRAFT_739409 [Peniophora sp. CONT]